MSYKRFLMACVLVLSVLSLNSCLLLAGAAIGAGAGAVAYSDNSYSLNMDASLKNTYTAALKAVEENDNLVLVSKKVSSKSAEIEGVTKINSTNFTIKIGPLAKDSSKVNVVFGTFGDQKLSNRLLTEIQNNT